MNSCLGLWSVIEKFGHGQVAFAIDGKNTDDQFIGIFFLRRQGGGGLCAGADAAEQAFFGCLSHTQSGINPALSGQVSLFTSI